MHYNGHIFNLKHNVSGRGGFWKCKYSNYRSRVKKPKESFCPLESIVIMDGKVYDDKNLQDHNHESDFKLMMKQKLGTQLISIVKQRKIGSPYAKFDLKQEYNTLKSQLDLEKFEIIPDFQETQDYLKKLVKTFYSYMEEDIFTKNNPIHVSIHTIKTGSPEINNQMSQFFSTH